MSSIFLRIYGGLLFTLILVTVLSGLALTIINSQRLLDYREVISRGTFRVVALELAEQQPAEREALLKQYRALLGINLRLVQGDATGLDTKDKDRMHQGNVVVDMLNDQLGQVTSWVQGDQYLQGRVETISDRMAEGTVRLLRARLMQLPVEERSSALARLGEHNFSYPLALVKPSETRLMETQLNQLDRGQTIMVLNSGDHSFSFFIGFPDDQRLLEVGPVPMMELYPFRLVITVALFILTSISLAIYVLVRGLERRLRKMEQAATALAKGDLETRVRVRGSDSVGRVAASFNAMAGHIQRLLSIQQEMIRGVSHELRTPVARLRFGLAMIDDAETNAERSRYLAGMDKDIQELDELVDEILTYASLEQGAPEIRFQPADIDQICGQVVADHIHIDQIEIVHGQTNAGFELCRADVEERYIQRAIQNLVGNACRYAESKVQVTYSASNETCRVDVDDDGPGIPEDKRDKIFDAFARLDGSRTKATGGYGLGLSIVRRIMLWHHGRATVTKSSLGGARFSLIWPRRQPH